MSICRFSFAAIRGFLAFGFVFMLASTASSSTDLHSFALAGLEPYTQEEITDLHSFGSAMTRGMLLRPKQADLFEIYRRVFFGDPGTGLNGKTLSSVLDVLGRHPELKKPHFREYNLSWMSRVYETPGEVDKFLRNQMDAAGRVRSTLFQIQANIGAWKKILDYQEPEMPAELSRPPAFLAGLKGKERQNLSDEQKSVLREQRERQSAFQQRAQARFERYVERIISKANPDLDYLEKTRGLYKTLDRIRLWLTRKNRSTSAIRQAMVDLVHTVGYGNQATQSLLKSKDGLERIEGFIKILDERDVLAMDLGFSGHFKELQSNLEVAAPTGMDISQDYAKLLVDFEAKIKSGRFTLLPAETIRVRSLSIQEAPFRSCLGGSDCSSRTYFSRALDPNYIYFTMTDAKHHSSGHVTVVLGTAQTSAGQTVKVAFVDKLQNVSNQLILPFLESVRQSLAEKGYLLGLPADVGNENGLSNIDVTRHFVAKELLPGLEESLKGFTPHPHPVSYHFDSAYSRAHHSPDLKIFVQPRFDGLVEIKAGQDYHPTLAPAALNKETLVRDFLKLRDSQNDGDVIRYISSGPMIAAMEKIGLYSSRQFEADLSAIAQDRSRNFPVRKRAVIEILLRDGSSGASAAMNLDRVELAQLTSEIKQWVWSVDQRKRRLVESLASAFQEAIKSDNAFSAQFLIEFLDPNEELGNTGNTPLNYSIYAQKTEVLKALLKNRRVNVNKTSAYGTSPLLYATSAGELNQGRADYVQLLLQRPDIDLNQADKAGDTPLMSAASRLNVEAVRALLSDPRIDVNRAGYHAETALHRVLMRSNINHEQMERARQVLLAMLEAPGINVNVQDQFQQSPLATGLLDGNTEVIKLLIQDRRIDLNHGCRGGSALAAAIEKKNNEIIQILLKDPRLDFGAKNEAGESILMTALRSKAELELIKTLLRDPRTDINAQYSHGGTALSIVLAGEDGNGHPGPNDLEKINLLIERPDINVNLSGGTYTGAPLIQAVRARNFEAATLLLRVKGIDVNVQDDRGSSALAEALRYLHNETSWAGDIDEHIYAAHAFAQALLAHPEVDVNRLDQFGHSPLVSALSINDSQIKLDVVSRLLKHPKINSKVVHSDGKTALSLGRWQHSIGLRNHSNILPLLGRAVR